MKQPRLADGVARLRAAAAVVPGPLVQLSPGRRTRLQLLPVLSAAPCQLLLWWRLGAGAKAAVWLLGAWRAARRRHLPCGQLSLRSWCPCSPCMCQCSLCSLCPCQCSLCLCSLCLCPGSLHSRFQEPSEQGWLLRPSRDLQPCAGSRMLATWPSASDGVACGACAASLSLWETTGYG